jgi:hypothetical protein
MSLSEHLSERRKSGRAIPTSSVLAAAAERTAAAAAVAAAAVHSGAHVPEVGPATAHAPSSSSSSSSSSSTTGTSGSSGSSSGGAVTISGAPVHSFMANKTVFTIDKRYQPVRGLGRGSSGVVVACTDGTIGANGRRVAVKKITDVGSTHPLPLMIVYQPVA